MPMPEGASVHRDAFNFIQSYMFTSGSVKVTVVQDTTSETGNDTGPVTNFGIYKWKTDANDEVKELTKDVGGTALHINELNWKRPLKPVTKTVQTAHLLTVKEPQILISQEKNDHFKSA